MIVEERDPISGAILFKEDEDTRNLKFLIRTVKDLTDRVKKLEETIESYKKDS